MTLKVRILQFCGSNNFDQKCSKNISMSFLWSVEYKLHFEKFLSNSVDMVKNLHQDQISFCSSYSLCWAGTVAQGSNSRRRQGSPHRCCRSQENLSTQLCWRVRKLFSWRLLEKRPQQPHQTASIQLAQVWTWTSQDVRRGHQAHPGGYHARPHRHH